MLHVSSTDTVRTAHLKYVAWRSSIDGFHPRSKSYLHENNDFQTPGSSAGFHCNCSTDNNAFSILFINKSCSYDRYNVNISILFSPLWLNHECDEIHTSRDLQYIHLYIYISILWVCELGQNTSS